MKKIAIFATLGVVMAGTANAGLLDSLGLTKKAEPQSLAEACDTNEIKKICPEIILGDMTLADCLKSNISALSQQCANYVKKSISEGAGGLLAAVEEAKADAANADDAANSKAAEVKEAAAETIESAKRTGGLLKSLF